MPPPGIGADAPGPCADALGPGATRADALTGGAHRSACSHLQCIPSATLDTCGCNKDRQTDRPTDRPTDSDQHFSQAFGRFGFCGRQCANTVTPLGCLAGTLGFVLAWVRLRSLRGQASKRRLRCRNGTGASDEMRAERNAGLFMRRLAGARNGSVQGAQSATFWRGASAGGAESAPARRTC